MKKITVMAVAIALCLTASAQAASVTFTLYLGQFAGGEGQYKLTAKASEGDNFGIASYGVQLVGVATIGPGGSILTVNHNSLRAASVENAATDEGPAGFTVLRSADENNAATGVAVLNIAASQDTVVPTPHLIRGFGQTAGNIADRGLIGTAAEGNPWGNAGVPGPNSNPTVGEFEIARGTYVGNPGGGFNGIPHGIDFIAQGTAATFANMFTEATGAAVVTATTVNRVVVAIPEPATMALVGIGAMGLVAVARRRRA